MTSIGTTAGTTSTAISGAAQRPHRHGGKDAMADVAKTLGMTSDDLRSQLSSGKSLNDIANANGVSHDDLIAAIKKGMPADAAGKADATRFAEKIAARQGRSKRPEGPPPGAGPADTTTATATGCNATSQPGKLSQIGSLLGMSADEVSGQVSSGNDLVTLLKNHGVDVAQLKSVLDQGDLVDVSA